MVVSCMEMPRYGGHSVRRFGARSGTLVHQIVTAAESILTYGTHAREVEPRVTSQRDEQESENVDYEAVAKKLIVYSRSLAKGSLSSVGGASVGETPVLQFLVGNPEVIPSELAKKLGFSRARMSHILDSLETKGYITRTQDEHDRRRVIVSITESGREYAQQKNAESVSSLAQQLSVLGEHDANELVRILNKAYSITYDMDDYLDNL